MKRVWVVGMTCWVVLLLTLALTGCFGARDSSSVEERAIGIDKSLICPVCPGETIDQSQVELAKQMRALVREKLAQGESEEEIRDFFVDRYGISVLAEPPKGGFNLMVWIVPPLALLGGGVALFLVVREMRRGSSSLSQGSEELDEKALEPYLSLVDEELNSLEPSYEPGKGDSKGPNV